MRRAAFLDLIVGDAQMRGIVDRFRDDAGLGLVGPRRFPSASRAQAARCAWAAQSRDRRGARGADGRADIGDAFDFFEGTMFWVATGLGAAAPARARRRRRRGGPGRWRAGACG